jgi:hypothetical protein
MTQGASISGPKNQKISTNNVRFNIQKNRSSIYGFIEMAQKQARAQYLQWHLSHPRKGDPGKVTLVASGTDDSVTETTNDSLRSDSDDLGSG